MAAMLTGATDIAVIAPVARLFDRLTATLTVRTLTAVVASVTPVACKLHRFSAARAMSAVAAAAFSIATLAPLADGVFLDMLVTAGTFWPQFLDFRFTRHRSSSP